MTGSGPEQRLDHLDVTVLRRHAQRKGALLLADLTGAGLLIIIVVLQLLLLFYMVLYLVIRYDRPCPAKQPCYQLKKSLIQPPNDCLAFTPNVVN